MRERVGGISSIPHPHRIEHAVLWCVETRRHCTGGHIVSPRRGSCILLENVWQCKLSATDDTTPIQSALQVLDINFSTSLSQANIQYILYLWPDIYSGLIRNRVHSLIASIHFRGWGHQVMEPASLLQGSYILLAVTVKIKIW